MATKKGMEDISSVTLATWIGKLIRKIAFAGFLAPVLAWLYTKEMITPDSLESGIVIVSGIIAAAIIALWSDFILPWILKNIFKKDSK